MSDEDHEVIKFRIAALETTVNEIRTAVKSIAETLHTLARLEERHAETREAMARAFGEIEDHEGRLRCMETDMPTLRLARGWIITAILAITATAGLAVLQLVLKH